MVCGWLLHVGWCLVFGYRSLVVGCLRVASWAAFSESYDVYQLVVGGWSFVDGCRLLVVGFC